MSGYLGRIIIDEVTDAVMGNATEFRPFTKRADGGLAAGREDARGAESDDVGELGGEAGSGNRGRIHAQGAVSMRSGTGRNGHEKARAGKDAGW